MKTQSVATEPEYFFGIRQVSGPQVGVQIPFLNPMTWLDIINTEREGVCIDLHLTWMRANGWPSYTVATTSPVKKVGVEGSARLIWKMEPECFKGDGFDLLSLGNVANIISVTECTKTYFLETESSRYILLDSFPADAGLKPS